MTRFTIPAIFLALSCPTFAQQGADSISVASVAEPVTGFAIDGSFELAIPSGSHGQWHTGSGAALVGSYRLPLGSQGWFFRPALGVYYNTMGNDYFYTGDAVYDGTVKNFGIRIPLMAGYTFTPNDNLSLSVATGPWMKINLFARQYGMPDATAQPAVPRSVNLFHRGFRRVEALWGISLSATFREHYTVGITTGVAFTPLARYGNRDNKIRIRRNTIALSLGYNF